MIRSCPSVKLLRSLPRRRDMSQGCTGEGVTPEGLPRHLCARMLAVTCELSVLQISCKAGCTYNCCCCSALGHVKRAHCVKRCAHMHMQLDMQPALKYTFKKGHFARYRWRGETPSGVNPITCAGLGLRVCPNSSRWS